MKNRVFWRKKIPYHGRSSYINFIFFLFKLENNEAIKKGFKVQTEHLKRQINFQMTKNNGLMTQLKSDQHTINYLSLRCSQLANEFKDLEVIPKRIKLETRKANVKPNFFLSYTSLYPINW